MSHFLNLKQIINSLLERYHPFKIRYFKISVVIVMTLLLGIVLILGWVSSKKVREVVTADFNQQQLLLAKHAAIMIEDSLYHLGRELSLLSFSPSIQYAETVFMGKRMEIAFSSIEDG